MSNHPSTFIKEEMDERGWSLEDLTIKMSNSPEEYGINYLALDMYFIVGPEKTSCRIGDRLATDLAKVFGVSKELFLNLEKSWLEEQRRIDESN